MTTHRRNYLGITGLDGPIQGFAGITAHVQNAKNRVPDLIKLTNGARRHTGIHPLFQIMGQSWGRRRISSQVMPPGRRGASGMEVVVDAEVEPELELYGSVAREVNSLACWLSILVGIARGKLTEAGF
ncbi:hypothetical protein EYZ11_007450 [Aspergillus tanneri]|uniref:Uncharacterized protein n=1 Tax=Aspergillus tanneri TaxID=1220188 RepID=A0A4V3UNZ4_9EURO|nr:uncharacterized protein ATNIH1004_004929 [Aspergillus tanneri]KAA8649038.1 hypothetical protein ATNIH1004_004929 [Aspergillus tanneri]THC93084.1 hypothetical protein EYZ11_007450 [Aspergillus tanneri]